MKIHLKSVITVALLALGPQPVAAGADGLDSEDLDRWTAALIHARDMTPQWAVQGADAFKASSDAGVPVVYLDVRKPEEWENGVIEGATLVRLTELATQPGLAKLPADKSAVIAVYCKSGHRSALAIPLLHQLGYVNASSMKGGYDAWAELGFPVSGAKEN